MMKSPSHRQTALPRHDLVPLLDRRFITIAKGWGQPQEFICLPDVRPVIFGLFNHAFVA